MDSQAKKWVQVLERRYGVRPEFAGHLLPILERLSDRQPSLEEWDQVLHGLAAAYRSSRDLRGPEPSESEMRVLLDQFGDEVRKMHESIKVLGVCLQRLHRRIGPASPAAERTLH